MKPTDTPDIMPDENNQDATAPLAGIEPGPDSIPEGIDTAPEGSPDDPDVPGQPERPDDVGGV